MVNLRVEVAAEQAASRDQQQTEKREGAVGGTEAEATVHQNDDWRRDPEQDVQMEPGGEAAQKRE
jgi:hypothetical protein